MAITIASMGSGTLPVVNNDVSSVEIDDTDVSTGDTIILTPTSILPKDIKLQHCMYVYEIDDGVGFTVKSSHKDMPLAVTFNYIVFTGTA